VNNSNAQVGGDKTGREEGKLIIKGNTKFTTSYSKGRGELQLDHGGAGKKQRSGVTGVHQGRLLGNACC